MRLAIVGSVSLAGNADAERIINDVLDRYAPTEVVSGGAVGIDQMAARVARSRGIQVTEYLPKHNRWAPDGFKDRNLLIAQNCDAIIRIAARGSKTYGSGWTRDRAVEMGKQSEEYIL